ncbi:flagellar hook-length control protein FliK [Craterilacuibacter sp. RT1T]|uniref:flagellar hook-length control protein FliK n=1 Tax=Craterilacuibacter sp. RT1T TaxID=2942211 RepID=UPI0020C17BB5|nr:flagellar hook-length control protein FliK [Craterilacuibacter sp. RT1T]MCL6262268.1 flagellar hook-length control protein FliK [Craterilacuibacter sp. RT1T]
MISPALPVVPSRTETAPATPPVAAGDAASPDDLLFSSLLAHLPQEEQVPGEEAERQPESPLPDTAAAVIAPTPALPVMSMLAAAMMPAKDAQVELGVLPVDQGSDGIAVESRHALVHVVLPMRAGEAVLAAAVLPSLPVVDLASPLLRQAGVPAQLPARPESMPARGADTSAVLSGEVAARFSPASPLAQADGETGRLAIASDAGMGVPWPAGTKAGAAPLPEWAPLTLDAGKSASWGESLRSALGERLQLQSAHGMDKALIRLDPPRLGALEISIRHEGGGLSVQLTASNPDVVRQLQAIGEGLRQDLAQRQFSQVSVDVREGQAGAGQGQGRQGGQQHSGQAPGKALAEADIPGEVFELGQGFSRV